MYVKQLRRRAVSLVLCAAILLQAAPVFLPEAQALEVTDVGSFEPVSQQLEMQFKLQYTQPLDIEVYVKDSDGNEVLRGYIVQNQEFNGYDGPLYAVDPCDDPSGMRSVRTADSAPQGGDVAQESTDGNAAENADEPESGDAPETNAADIYAIAPDTQLPELTPPAEDADAIGKKTFDRAAIVAQADNPMISDVSVSIKDKSGTSALDASIDETEPGKYTMTWDGRINVGGKPYSLIGDIMRDQVGIVVVIQPLGYPDRNSPCTTNTDGSMDHGENWTWTKKFAAPFSAEIDYRLYDLLGELNTNYSGYVNEFIEIYTTGSWQAAKEYLQSLGIDPAAFGIGATVAEDPVNIASGAYVSAYNDLRLEGATPLTLEREYNSRYDGGSLGRGFTHSYEYMLREDKGILLVTLPYGEELHFIRRQPGFGTGYHTLQNSGYTLEDGGSGYMMRHKSGAAFDFTIDGNLMQVTNASGVDSVTLSYNGSELSRVQGVAGAFDLTWDGAVISLVTDSAGRSVQYTHDGMCTTKRALQLYKKTFHFVLQTI